MFFHPPRLMMLAVGHHQERGQRPGMIVLAVQLDRSLGLAELRPGKRRQAQIDGRRVNRIQRILKTKLVFGR